MSGLLNGGVYTFFVAGKSAHFESERVAANNGQIYMCKCFMHVFMCIMLMTNICLVPGSPQLSLISISTDSVTVSWTVPTGTVVEYFDLQWSVEEDQRPITTSTDRVATNRYTVSGLRHSDNAKIYIVVTASNGAGRNSSTPLTIHSSILQSQGPEGGSTNNNASTIHLGALIGGAVAIFLVSIAAGTFISFVVHKCSQKYKKAHKK